MYKPLNFYFTCLLTLTLVGCNGSSDNPPIDEGAEPLSFAGPLQAQGDAYFVSGNFSGSGNCSSCHDGLLDANNADVSIGTDWSSSMMANATRDPFWKAKVRSELNRNPALAELINDKCTRCHAPMANEEMKRNGEYISLFGDGFLSEENARHDEAMDGVSCTLCHQIPDSDTLGTLDGVSGKFEVNNSKIIFGPYDNLVAQPMINHSGYVPSYSAHIKESDLCASCHELKTPYVDEFSNILSQTPEDEFPEQTPYSEWLHSDFAMQKSCQDCHMSRSDGVIISSRPGWLTTQRDNFALHDFIGANKMMLDILDSNREQLGVRSTNFAETIAKTEVMLQSSASIESPQSSLSSGVLAFDLKINSSTGHKLPSAYPSRRVILHVTVRDSRGDIVFESGRVNDDGSVNGLDADQDLQRYEPHYELITEPEQVQVYEAIMVNNHDEVTYTLLRSMRYIKDNRILPIGFDKSTASSDIAVRGSALNDDNFTGGSDQITYQVDGLYDVRYTVEAELFYQTIAYAFAQDLFSVSGDEIEDFKLMYENANYKSSVITTLEFEVN